MIPAGDWHHVAFGESTFVAPTAGNPDVTYGSRLLQHLPPL